MTAEHVWPDWLSAELPAEELTTFTFDREGQAAKVWKGRPTSTTVRAVCAVCNNGWMSNLETPARPLLVEMVRGVRSRFIGPADQRAISAWAFKTAVMVDQMNPVMGSAVST